MKNFNYEEKKLEKMKTNNEELKEKEAAKRKHYQFYLENCVDEEKGEIALSFENWVKNHFDVSFLTCKLNGIQL